MRTRNRITAVIHIAMVGAIAPAVVGVLPAKAAAPGGYAKTAASTEHGSTGGTEAQQRARKARCGGHPWPDATNTFGRKYSPRIGKEAASLIQWKLADRTFSSVWTNNPRVMITVESKEKGRCGWFKVRRSTSGNKKYYRRTGTLYNIGDSVRACIKIGSRVDCGKWFRDKD